MSSFGAVLDACVLYPAALVDTLLRAALWGMYRPHWSADILRELQRALTLRVGIDAARRRITQMRQVFDEAEVTGYQLLLAAMTNDAKDRHVVAAAVQAGAQVIVTDNVRDFPEAALAPHGLEAQTADSFLLHLHGLQPDAMREIVQRQAAALRRPTKSFDDVLAHLAKQAPGFVDHITPRPAVTVPHKARPSSKQVPVADRDKPAVAL